MERHNRPPMSALATVAVKSFKGKLIEKKISIGYYI